MRERREPEADWMLLRAQADAELAQALAERSYQSQQAERTAEQVRVLVQQSTASQQPSKE